MRDPLFNQAEIDFLSLHKNSEHTRILKSVFEKYYDQTADCFISLKTADQLFVAQGMLKGIKACINLMEHGAGLKSPGVVENKLLLLRIV